jgi:hypothetical protein
VSRYQADYPIATMCRVLGVSTSGYYAWEGRQASKRAQADAALIKQIRKCHAASHGTYGAPRIHADLVALGYTVNRKRVARLMRAAGLKGVTRRRFVTTTVRDDTRPAPDLVDRNFTADHPNKLWVADITYLPTWAGFLYLAVVIDVIRAVSSAGLLRQRCTPELCSMPSTWRCNGAGHAMSSTTPIKARNIHRLRLASVAARLARGRQWARSVIAMTTHLPRVSLQRWSASCSIE